MTRKFWLGMLVMALAFGMTVIGCQRTERRDAPPQDADADAPVAVDATLVGTWLDDEDDGEFRVHADGNWEQWFEGSPAMRGTYTSRDGTITLRINHIHGNLWSDLMMDEGIPLVLEPQWYSRTELRAATVDAIFAYIVADEGLTPAEVADYAMYILEEVEWEMEEEFDPILNELFSPIPGFYSISGNTLTLTLTMMGETTTTTYTRR